MVQELRKKIIKANEMYRIGKPIISDSKYDLLLEELEMLSPGDELLNRIGHSITEDRKSRLPIEMASMNKIKTIDDINDWCRLKFIPKTEKVIITPKFDGLSLCVNEETSEAWTRGDGEFGQKSNEHYKLIQNHLYEDTPFSPITFGYTYGEVMMPKKVFIENYSGEFANPRNLVSGLLNSKEASEPLKDCNYIKYGGIPSKTFSPKTKQDIIDELNSNQKVKVNFEICKISDLTEEMLIDLFHKWSIEYEIDGLIIEINDLELQDKLGRETSSNNPVWARAFKHESFEQSAESEVIDITWNISKQGFLKPTLRIKPVKLDGVIVSNVTGNNARFVKDLGLGVGAKVMVKRSGMVIPIISDIIEPVEFVMPNIPNITWNENEVELMTIGETDEQNFKRVVSFFEILEAKGVSEGIIKQFWTASKLVGPAGNRKQVDLVDKTSFHSALKDILNLTEDDMLQIYRFGKRKASLVHNSIQNSIKEVELSKLQHATGLFKGLGSKKLALLEKFTSKPTVDEVMTIEGFAEISAKSYVESYSEYFTFIKDLPIKTFSKMVQVVTTGVDMAGTSFIFTGVRRKDLEQQIESRGGKISGAVSKTTTHLVAKSIGSGSSKEKKAIELGVKIITIEDLEKMLK
jgi:DNA ligase (NAD+)